MSSIPNALPRHRSSSDQNNRRPTAPVRQPNTTTDEMIGATVPRKLRSASLKRPHDSGAEERSAQAAMPSSSSNASRRKKRKSNKPKTQIPKKAASSKIEEEIENQVAELLSRLRSSRNNALSFIGANDSLPLGSAGATIEPENENIEDYTVALTISAAEPVRIESEEEPEIMEEPSSGSAMISGYQEDDYASGKEMVLFEFPNEDIEIDNHNSGDNDNANGGSEVFAQESPSGSNSQLDVDQLDSASFREVFAVSGCQEVNTAPGKETGSSEFLEEDNGNNKYSGDTANGRSEDFAGESPSGSKSQMDDDNVSGKETGSFEFPKLDNEKGGKNSGDTANGRSEVFAGESPLGSKSQMNVDKLDSASTREVSAASGCQEHDNAFGKVSGSSEFPKEGNDKDNKSSGDTANGRSEVFARESESSSKSQINVDKLDSASTREVSTVLGCQEDDHAFGKETGSSEFPNEDNEKDEQSSGDAANGRSEVFARESPSGSKSQMDVDKLDSASTIGASAVSGANNLRGDKFVIDLMAPPPMTPSPERENEEKQKENESKQEQMVEFFLSQPEASRCVTHQYIATNISKHQQCERMEPLVKTDLSLKPPNAPAHLLPPGRHQASVTRASSHADGVNSTGSASSSSKSHSSAAGSFITTTTLPAFLSPMSSSYPNLVVNDAPYMTTVQSNGYTFPILTPLGAASAATRGASPAQSTHILNGTLYSSQLSHPLQHPQQHNIQAMFQPLPSSHKQSQGMQVNNNVYPSTSMQLQQSQKEVTSLSHPLKLETGMAGQNAKSVASGKSYSQKNVFGQDFTIPAQPVDLTFRLSTGSDSVSGNGGNFVDKRQPPQAMKGGAEKIPSQVAFRLSTGSDSVSGNGGNFVDKRQPPQAMKGGAEKIPSQVTFRLSTGSDSVSGNGGNFVDKRQPPQAMKGGAEKIPSQVAFRLSTGSDSVSGNGGNFVDKRQPPQAMKGGAEQIPSQAFATSYAGFNGTSVPSNLNFSTMAQNPVTYQNMRDATWPGYQAASTYHSTQQKIYSLNEGKSGGGSSHQDDEKRATSGKPSTNGPTTLVFDNSLKSLNFASSPMNINWLSRSITSSAATTSLPLSSNVSNHQQASQLLHLQQQQHHGMLQKHPSMASLYQSSSTTSNGTTATIFFNSPPVFAQTQTQWKSSNQAPQSRNSGRIPDSQVSSVVTSSTPTFKNLSREQGRALQGHQQRPFGGNYMSPRPSQGQQLLRNNQPLGTTTPIAGIPPHGGNLKPSSQGSKAGSAMNTSQVQQNEKNSSAGTGKKSSQFLGEKSRRF